jgi:hypothetical protein
MTTPPTQPVALGSLPEFPRHATPLEFNYTRPPGNMDVTTTKSTKVKTLAYNATIEVVLQNTVLVVRESHPMHLHGHTLQKTPPLATHICVSTSQNKCWYDLYQRIRYALFKVALQGSIATHIYVLVRGVCKRCMLTTKM